MKPAWKRFRYLGCVNGQMLWESVGTLPNDSRVEQVRCSWVWFWGIA